MKSKKRFLLYLVGIVAMFLMCISVASAQNKVVVIPLISDAPPPVLPPCAQGYTNSIGMAFNLLPAGTFTMGSPVTEPGRVDVETQHQVTLTQSFYMQTTEVTNGQWNAVIVDTGLGVNPSVSHTGDQYPVEWVNWYEAASFANFLSAGEGLSPCYNGQGTCSGTLGVNFSCTTVIMITGCTGYRLPTEAQWEYAARAGTTTAYANPYHFDADNTEIEFGFNSNLHAMGWYGFNNRGGDLDRDVPGFPSGTKPVAQKQANRWGLYDMHGNMPEWCQDWYADYPSGAVTDPQGPGSGSFRVVRDAGYSFYARNCRSAHRMNEHPVSPLIYMGFRLALPPGQ